jgi:hypothetical protein
LLLLAVPLLARAAEVPPELRGRIAVEVTSCEPLREGAPARAVLLRVRAGASSLRQPEVRCGAFVPGTDRGLGWTRVAGLDPLPAESARAVMTLVPADTAHSECRCVAGAAATEAVACAPWESLENGRCVEPGEQATASTPANVAYDDVTAALGVSRALATLRAQLEHEQQEAPPASATPCDSVVPAQIAPLVFALVPEDETVHVTPLWSLLGAADQRAFSRWSADCFGVSRIVDAERGIEIEGSAAWPAQPARAR